MVYRTGLINNWQRKERVNEMFRGSDATFLAAYFVTVPLVISVAALVWIFRSIDGFTARGTERRGGCVAGCREPGC